MSQTHWYMVSHLFILLSSSFFKRRPELLQSPYSCIYLLVLLWIWHLVHWCSCWALLCWRVPGIHAGLLPTAWWLVILPMLSCGWSVLSPLYRKTLTSPHSTWFLFSSLGFSPFSCLPFSSCLSWRVGAAHADGRWGGPRGVSSLHGWLLPVSTLVSF